MHAVIRTYAASPDVAAEARPQLDETPGFVAYYFLETNDGIATVTITEDETGVQESMGRAAAWVQQHLPHSNLGAPAVIRGQVVMHAANAPSAGAGTATATDLTLAADEQIQPSGDLTGLSETME